MATWTEERVEELKKLHHMRLSNGLIAMKLGVSRNACIGKLHRLGLGSGGRPPVKRLPGNRQAYKNFGHRRRKGDMSARQQAELAHINSRRKQHGYPPYASLAEYDEMQAVAKAELAAILGAPDIVVPPSERKTLQQLEDNDCKWPFGDPKEPDFHFGCSGKRVHGLPYCARHSARAYTPDQPKHPPTEHSWGGKKDHPTPSTSTVPREFDAMEPV